MVYRDPTPELLSAISSLPVEQRMVLVNSPDKLQAFAASLTKPARQTKKLWWPWWPFARTITVDYSMSLSAMIEAGCVRDNGDWIKNFPIVGQGTVDSKIYLVRFWREVSDEQVKDYLEARGLEPGKLEHLLAYSAKFGGRRFPIMALGSLVKCSGICSVPYLRRDYISRSEYNLSWPSKWLTHCRFIAVSPVE
ncbi:MAG: hypothetical protein A2754_02630 [Candidatus Magasanikbacteria bacterium RIFCSPHIGHO2_01_FULL_47_8]|uniref:Uncharacterized protein n=1 Tax=Candidatus Magasanikbacteria bacterium RIFCSPHIGHO2_01_FULL_47_8 TaxID=1798673 RepID=A0A1F6MGY1_9BACT|nr:MAG: hypothetical protein A2754_02630 [Candidatus Magasanikbacteria bacterium RIFCSPHIGHO2_01_FULL_47_8]